MVVIRSRARLWAGIWVLGQLSTLAAFVPRGGPMSGNMGLVVLAASLVLVGQSRVWAQADATLTGRVVALVDGSPVAGAVVSLKSATGGPVMESGSDESGRFTLQLVVPGEYVLSCTAKGFLVRELALSLEPRESRSVSVGLDLKPMHATVEVEAEASPISSTHSPSSTVLTAGRLEAMPASKLESLPEAIVTAAPGMIRGHDDFVHVRGHEVALNPVINGVSFWENPHSLFSSGLSPAIIETVNVMTGGFPAEYGNRFGGVLDIVTKSGLRMNNEGSISVSAGDAGRRRAAGEFGGHRGGLGYFMFGSWSTSERFLSPPDPQAVHNTGRGARAFIQLDGNLRNAGSARLALAGEGANFEVPKHPRDVEMRPDASAEQRTRQQSAILGWTRAWSEVAVSASLYQRWSTAHLLPARSPLSAAASFERTLLTAGGKIDVTRVAGRHVLKAGIDAVHLRPEEALSYDYAGFREFTHLLGWPHVHFGAGAVEFAGRQVGRQFSAYAQDTVQFGERLSADLGLRIDSYELVSSESHASPRLNLAVQVPGGTLLHASYNHFFVPPPIEGLLSSSAGLTASISEIGAPLPPLRPTTENQFELGLSRPFGALRLAATGYYRTTDNPVHTTVLPDSRIYLYASFDHEEAYGLEAKAEFLPSGPSGVSGYLNYALSRVDFFNPVTGGFVTEAAHLDETSRFLAPMDQTHTLSAGATYRHSRSGVSLSTTLEYGSGTPMGHGSADDDHAGEEVDHAHAAPGGSVPRVPGHLTAGLSVAVDLLRDSGNRGRLAVRIDVENISNRIYLIAQEGEFSAAQYSNPRLVMGTIRVRF